MNNNIKVKEKTFLLLIGILPFLPISSQLSTTFTGIMIFLFVLIFTLLSLKLLETHIEKKNKEGFVIIISIFFLLLLRIFLMAIGLDIVKKIGVYYSLIGVNCFILFLYENSVNTKIKIKMILKRLSISFFILIIISFIREILGTGKLNLLFRFGECRIGGIVDFNFIISIFSSSDRITFGLPLFILPAGGFFLTGLIMAIYQYLNIKKANKN